MTQALTIQNLQAAMQVRTEDPGLAFPIMAYMPELPRPAQLTDAEKTEAAKAGHWLDDYITFANRAAPMTPTLLNQTYGLSLLATAIARRVFVRAGKETFYPNLYALLVAPSTLYTKTTGLKVSQDVMEKAGINYLTLPTGVTPQSLISELTTRTPSTFGDWVQDDKEEWQKERQFAAQRAWWMDEAASLLDLFKQKHTADLLGLMLRLYDCPNKMTAATIGRGRETVRYAYLNICGPTTPAAMRAHLKNPELWGDGLFARFLFVTPDTPPIRSFYSQEVIEVPDELAKKLNTLAFVRLEKPEDSGLGHVKVPPAIQAQTPPEVWEKWDSYHAGLWSLLSKKSLPEKLYASYGRLHTIAMKIAMLLAASDWAEMSEGNPLIIRPAHWARAQMITEGYRASLHRMIDDASQPVDNEDQELAEKIISRVNTTNRNSRRELAQDLHMSAGHQRIHFDLIITQLIQDGLIKEQEVKQSRGPATKRIFPVNP